MASEDRGRVLTDGPDDDVDEELLDAAASMEYELLGPPTLPRTYTAILPIVIKTKASAIC